MHPIWAWLIRLLPKEMHRRELMCLSPYLGGVGLDVGCGRRKAASSAMGVDLFAYHGVDLVADAIALPIRRGCLDYVCSVHSLEHCREPRAALQEWLLALRPGGVVCLVLPDVTYTGAANTDRTAHWHHWALDSFLAWLEEMGMGELVEVAREACPRWSFLVVLRKPKASGRQNE